MQPCFHPMRCFPHNFIVSREWEMRKQPMDSLWLVPLPDRSSEGVVAKDGGAEDSGAVSLRPGPCSKLFGRTVGMPKKKSRCSMPGPPPLMTYPSPNRATKYLCVRLTRPACSRLHVSAWFDRATTGVPRDGPNHSGAAEPTSSGHLTGGFAWGRSAARLSFVQRPWHGPAPCGQPREAASRGPA